MKQGERSAVKQGERTEDGVEIREESSGKCGGRRQDGGETREEEYQDIGEMEGYRVYLRFEEEGPDVEEALALFYEAADSVLFQNLARPEEPSR